MQICLPYIFFLKSKQTLETIINKYLEADNHNIDSCPSDLIILSLRKEKKRNRNSTEIFFYCEYDYFMQNS
jgi:hypothetical protein